MQMIKKLIQNLKMI